MANGDAKFKSFGPFFDSNGAIYRGIVASVTSPGGMTAKDYYTSATKSGNTVSTGLLTDSDNDGIISGYFDGIYRIRIGKSGSTLLSFTELDVAIDYASVLITSDMGSEWEENFGTAYPVANATNLYQQFALTDASANLLDIGVNVGSSFASTSTVVNVRWFGATGDGVTDDSTAIQNAINSVTAAGSAGELGGGGVIFFPPGIYLCNTGIINNGRKVSFAGSSRDNTTIKKGANIDLIKLDSVFNKQRIENMTLDGNSKTGALLHLTSSVYWGLQNLVFKNNGGVATTATDAAIYAISATVGHLVNVFMNNNTRACYFSETHSFTAWYWTIAGGSVYNDIEFANVVNVQLNAFSLEDGDSNTGGGVEFLGCWTVAINGMYCESSHQVNHITIGKSGSPTRNAYIRGIRTSRAGDSASSKATILVQSSSQNIIIDQFAVTKVNIVGAHTGGWIELAECYNVSIRNVLAQNMDATISAAGLIKTSGVGPDYLTIENVYEEATGSTASMLIRADNAVISNTNVPITLDTNSTKVVYNNCLGAITDTEKIGLFDPITAGILQRENTVTGSIANMISTFELTKLITTGTNSGALNDGTEGRRISIIHKTDGGSYALTPDNFANGTTITFTNVGDSAELLFTDSTWYFMGGTATIS